MEEKRSLGDTSAGSENYTEQPIIYPNSQIQKQPTDEWIDEWIKGQEELISFRATLGGSSTKPIFPISKIQKQSVDLQMSLQMFLQEATTFADMWKDVNIKFDDRRSFPTFLWLLQDSGLDWHKYTVSEDNDINVSNQPNRWSFLQAPSHDVVYLCPDSNWDMANKFYSKTLSLMPLLQKIHEKSPDKFSREQARKLEPFLGHLIMIQQEQRDVACSFSEHLEQLKKFDVASSLAFPSIAVDDDGDRGKCPLICSKHAMEYYMWQQEHLFDCLYIISRESTWLLKKLMDSRFTSPSFIEESQKIVEIIVDYISKFKESKEMLDRYLLSNFIGWPFIEDELTNLVLENKKNLDHFGIHITCLQKEGVGEGSVIENLLGCLGDVCKISLDGYGEKNTLCSLNIEYMKAVQETMELIEKAKKKLNSDRISTLRGGSPLGNLTLWRILFESSVAGLRLDLINKKYAEAIKLGVKLSEENRHPTVFLFVQEHLDRLRAEISLLLSDGDRVLLDFVAMHRTVAEITYMLGDALTTGGAGMNDLCDETSSPGSSSKSDEEMEMDSVPDFPWDKHNVPPEVEIDWSNLSMRKSSDWTIPDIPDPEDDDYLID